MLPTVKRPTADVEIVTDYATLAESRAVAKRIEQVESADMKTMTESEASANRQTVLDLRDTLDHLIRKTDETTLVLTLTGMTASKWEQIVQTYTSMQEGKPVQDTVTIIITAIPAMLTKAKLKGANESLDCSPQDVRELLEQLPDTAIVALLPQVQALNAPMFKLPK